MASGNLKITELYWANTDDLAQPEWKNHPIQSPYWSRKWEYPWVLSRAQISDNMTIVDAGSGNMNPLPVYLSKIYPDIKIFAVDVNPSPFPDTKQVKTLQENLLHTSIPSSSVDRVLCVSVLEHMSSQDWIPAIHEFHRIVKPQGHIVLTVDVEVSPRCGCAWNFKTHEMESFIAGIDSTVIIPPKPNNVLTSLTGSLPGEKELKLTVLGVVIKVI